MKTLYNPTGAVEDMLPVSLGGTGARIPKDIIKNLKLVSATEVGGANQPVLLDDEGVLPTTFRPEVLHPIYVPSIDGPDSVIAGQTVKFVITNYSTSIQYITTSSGGTALRSADIITFTADNDVDSVTNGKLIVNGFVFPLIIRDILPTDDFFVPEILRPLWAQQNVALDFIVEASKFNAFDRDTHVSSDWELATDRDFSNIVFSSYDDTKNLSSWDLGKMP